MRYQRGGSNTKLPESAANVVHVPAAADQFAGAKPTDTCVLLTTSLQQKGSRDPEETKSLGSYNQLQSILTGIAKSMRLIQNSEVGSAHFPSLDSKVETLWEWHHRRDSHLLLRWQRLQR